MKRLSLPAATLLALACTVPVQDVHDEAIVSRAPLTLQAVETAILEAARIRGWETQVVEPSHIVATLRVKEYRVTTDIFFETDRYSIRYRSSTNLDYDGTHIHRSYNRWIRNLNLDIRRTLPL